MPPGPLPELSDDILQYIASSQWEETPVCDESDICRDAAALMCVGNSFTTALGLKLYAAVSPYLGEESPGGVHEGSTAAEMRALLKDWGLSAGGKKSDMWARIAAEAGGGSELCPVADGVRARAIELKTARTTVGKARDTYGIYPYQIRSLPALEVHAPHLANLGKDTMKTYSIKDIKKIALTVWAGGRDR
ncbi:hypothetical protein Rsub_02218 [Raphidocelis subcapitata]|uniref:SAP domain-containing protein n=1 Tax=Raphidocelis subcapitata TaxID=307507 RepID=A0A2V0NP01_9CHLO|nr:hypothetical protein Rsub_02218 [Raphidocelis subcapitata]|eukprot:GBF89341.1 hypothetical protein Rsub_02218 [Raphidocelis subcapitata]